MIPDGFLAGVFLCSLTLDFQFETTAVLEQLYARDSRSYRLLGLGVRGFLCPVLLGCLRHDGEWGMFSQTFTRRTGDRLHYSPTSVLFNLLPSVDYRVVVH